MSVLKVAKLFERKLALASDKLSEDLRKIMVAASELAKTYDIYDEAYDIAQNLASRANQYWKMSVNPTQMIPAETISSWLKSLTNAAANVAKLATGPNEQTKLRALNNMIFSVQPINIGPKEDSGSTYSQPGHPGTGPWAADLGADESKLNEVVKNLAPKPNPWDPKAQEP